MENKTREVLNIMRRLNRKLFTTSGNSENSTIGLSQINILKEIINNKNLTQDELASNLNLDKTTIAKAVKKLEEKGLIIRSKSDVDRRKNKLVATDRAFEVKDKMNEHMREFTQSYFEGLSDEEIVKFKETLEKIELNLERNRSIMKDKKHVLLKVLKVVEENEGLSVEKLAELLNKDSNKVNKVVDKMIKKGILEKREDLLYALKNSSDLKQDYKEHHKEHKKDEKNKDHKKDKKHVILKVLKAVEENEGLSVEKLTDLLNKDSDKVNEVVDKMIEKGILEKREDLLYALKNSSDLKQDYKEHHKNHKKDEKNKAHKKDKKHVILKVLKAVEENEGLSVEKLAELLNKDSNKVNEVVDKMIEKGILEKREDLLYSLKNINDLKQEHKEHK